MKTVKDYIEMCVCGGRDCWEWTKVLKEGKKEEERK